MDAYVKFTPEGLRAMKSMEQLANLDICVGFQSDAVYEDQTTVAEVAYYNHFGTYTEDGSVDIPARPFMDAMSNHKEELYDFIAGAVRGMYSGTLDAKTALNEIGTYAKALIQEEIVEGDFAPNAPSTIKKKGSSKPLIDSAHMRQSVSFVIKEAET